MQYNKMLSPFNTGDLVNIRTILIMVNLMTKKN